MRREGVGEDRKGEGGTGLGVTSGLIGLCCSQERTGQAAAEVWCSGSWCSLCPGHGGRLGRCTPLLETTAAGKSSGEIGRGERERGRVIFQDGGVGNVTTGG